MKLRRRCTSPNFANKREDARDSPHNFKLHRQPCAESGRLASTPYIATSKSHIPRNFISFSLESLFPSIAICGPFLGPVTIVDTNRTLSHSKSDKPCHQSRLRRRAPRRSFVKPSELSSRSMFRQRTSLRKRCPKKSR